MSPALSYNDDATLADAFDNRSFIREVCKVIRDCSPPKGIGINGYWGTGKTSALAQVYYHLTGEYPLGEKPSDAPDSDEECFDKSVLPLWFEAWRYQNDPQPVVALLNEIRTKMGLWEKFKQKGGKLAGVSFLGILSAFDEVIKAASGGQVKPELGKLKDIGNAWEKERYQQPLPSQALRALLEAAVGEALKSLRKGKRKLVVFIDDLDRCEPGAALRLLEGIKVYLNLSNCVVVFGMDQRQIERALGEALRFGGTVENGNNGSWPGPEHQAREYLEKICQDIYHLPLPNKEKKSAFLDRLLVQLDLGQGAPQAPMIRDITSAYDCLPANPRKIKMLANRLALMLRRLPDGDGGDVFQPEPGRFVSRRCAVLLVVAIIYCFHRSVFEELARNPSYFITLFEYSSTGNTSEKKFAPMRGIVPSRNTQEELPVNPSDSNVFRLHRLLDHLIDPLGDEIKPFLNL